MMKKFVLLVFSIIVVLIQLSVEGSFFRAAVLPDIALAFVLVLVFANGFEGSVGWILLVGFLIDAGSGSVLGTTPLIYLLIGRAVSKFTTAADLKSRKILFAFSLGVLMAVSEILKDACFLAAERFFARYRGGSSGSFAIFFSPDYLEKIFFTIAALFATYYIFRKVSRALFIEPVRLAPKKQF